MAFAGSLVTSALRLLGVIGENQSPSPEQMADGIDTLNDFIDALNLDSLAVYQTTNDQVTTVPGQGVYTVGPGGNFNVDRPVQINAAYVDYQGVSFQLDETTQEEFNLITLKTMSQVLPRFFLYLNTFPLGTLQLWPVPSAAITLSLTVDRVIGAIAATDTLSLAPGYSKMFKFNLARELASQFNMPVSQDVMRIAKESLADIKRANRTPAVASYDTALVNRTTGLAGFLSGY